MRTPLQQFLIDRKLELLDKEKRATGDAKLVMFAQIQMTDVILMYLTSQQTEEDMAKLRLTLETQATPVDDIKPRQDNQELTEGLIELADELQKQFKEKLKKDPKITALKFPLNNLPDDIKPKSVSTKIYALKKQGKLPENIFPTTRTVKEKDDDGKVTVKEIVYMRCVKAD